MNKKVFWVGVFLALAGAALGGYAGWKYHAGCGNTCAQKKDHTCDCTNAQTAMWVGGAALVVGCVCMCYGQRGNDGAVGLEDGGGGGDDD